VKSRQGVCRRRSVAGRRAAAWCVCPARVQCAVVTCLCFRYASVVQTSPRKKSNPIGEMNWTVAMSQVVVQPFPWYSLRSSSCRECLWLVKRYIVAECKGMSVPSPPVQPMSRAFNHVLSHKQPTLTNPPETREPRWMSCPLSVTHAAGVWEGRVPKNVYGGVVCKGGVAVPTQPCNVLYSMVSGNKGCNWQATARWGSCWVCKERCDPPRQ